MSYRPWSHGPPSRRGTDTQPTSNGTYARQRDRLTLTFKDEEGEVSVKESKIDIGGATLDLYDPEKPRVGPAAPAPIEAPSELAAGDGDKAADAKIASIEFGAKDVAFQLKHPPGWTAETAGRADNMDSWIKRLKGNATIKVTADLSGSLTSGSNLNRDPESGSESAPVHRGHVSDKKNAAEVFSDYRESEPATFKGAGPGEGRMSRFTASSGGPFGSKPRGIRVTLLTGDRRVSALCSCPEQGVQRAQGHLPRRLPEPLAMNRAGRGGGNHAAPPGKPCPPGRRRDRLGRSCDWSLGWERETMRLVTVMTDRGPRACAEFQGRYVDVNQADLTLPDTVKGLLGLGSDGVRRIAMALPGGSRTHDPSKCTLMAPVPDPAKIVCLGLNYRDHAAESGMDVPTEPILFSKYATTLIGQGAEIVLPGASHEVDYEAELVVVVGKGGKDIPVDRAMEHVGGYSVGNDVSARDWQLGKPGKQWMAGKTFDTFAPVGPAIVTADEVPDPQALGIRLRLNGQTMQDSNTSQLVFPVDQIIAYLSGVFTLEPGDLIFTGTPPGVGMARKPPVWLQDGDVVEVEIDGLGVLKNPVVRR